MNAHVLLTAAVALVVATPSAAQLAERCSEIPADPPGRPSAEEVSRGSALRTVSNGVRDSVMQAAREAGVAQPEGLFVLEVRGRRADRVEVHSHEANVPETLVREVAARQADLLAILPERNRTLHFRLDPVPSVDPRPSVECEPRVLNVAVFRDELARIAQMERPLPAGTEPRVRMRLRMLVSREGEVVYAVVSRRGAVGRLDDEVVRAARVLRFAPAMLGDTAMDVWAELPVNFYMPVAARQ